MLSQLHVCHVLLVGTSVVSTMLVMSVFHFFGGLRFGPWGGLVVHGFRLYCRVHGALYLNQVLLRELLLLRHYFIFYLGHDGRGNRFRLRRNFSDLGSWLFGLLRLFVKQILVLIVVRL